MRLSAKIEYSLKAIMALAQLYASQKPLSMSKIAEKQGVSSKFLLQLMIRMKNAKIVTSVRGASGGYYLLKSPAEISVGEVVEAVDSTVTTTSLKQEHSLNIEENAIVHFWDRLNEGVKVCLEQTTIEDLLKDTQQQGVLVYSI